MRCTDGRAASFATPDADGATRWALETKIGKRRSRTAKRKASFTFASGEPHSDFLPRIEADEWRSCESPKLVKLKRGKHVFAIYAGDELGDEDPFATIKWKVLAQR